MSVTNKKVSTSVTIRYELWQWVKDHPQYTFSGLLESAILKQMELEGLVELNESDILNDISHRRGRHKR